MLCTDVLEGEGEARPVTESREWGMPPFTFDSLIILIEKLHCYTALENWNVPEGPTQWLLSLCRAAATLCLVSSQEEAWLSTLSPSYSCRDTNGSMPVLCTHYLLIPGAWGQEAPSVHVHSILSAHQFQNATEVNQRLRKILFYQSLCNIKITQ